MSMLLEQYGPESFDMLDFKLKESKEILLNMIGAFLESKITKNELAREYEYYNRMLKKAEEIVFGKKEK